MSRSKIPLRFTDSNQAWLAKMTGRGLQEVLCKPNRPLNTGRISRQVKHGCQFIAEPSMARLLRILYQGAFYHVTARGLRFTFRGSTRPVRIRRWVGILVGSAIRL